MLFVPAGSWWLASYFGFQNHRLQKFAGTKYLHTSTGRCDCQVLPPFTLLYTPCIQFGCTVHANPLHIAGFVCINSNIFCCTLVVKFVPLPGLSNDHSACVFCTSILCTGDIAAV